jgi:putative addiction module CopG family antidote
MRISMHINFSPEMEQYLQSKVGSGFYNNATEVVCDAIRRMREEDEKAGESLFLRKLLWASLPNKRQKLRDRLCLRRPQPSCFTRCIPSEGYAT